MRRRAGVRAAAMIAATIALGAGSLGVAWHRAEPTHDRAWQDGHQRIADLTVVGDSLHIGNLRDSRHFPDGTSETRWTEASYRISDVERIWFALSPFSSRVRALAHPFLSFEMRDGRFVVVSVEARRVEGQRYSAVRGLLPTYETLFVFGTEQDLLRLRAVAWGDPVYLFPIRVEPGQARELFAALVGRAQEIERQPEFYHTLTNNCTTNLIRPINQMVEIPVSWRIGVMPGYSFDEAYRRGWIDTDLPMEAARTAHFVNDRVAAALDDPGFSRAIRAGLFSGAADGDGGSPVGPQVFAPGVISDEQEQYRITFTVDGDTAYFGRSESFFPVSRQAFIYRSVRVAGDWQTPEIAPFSGTFSDIDPFISPDGRRLYFSSIRPIDGQDRPDLNTWVVERTPEGWSDPTIVPTASSTHDDLYPSVDRDGNLYFASNRPRPGLQQGWNIWVARRTSDGYEEPEPLGGGVNAEHTWEFNPAISANGRRLLFTRLDVRDPEGTGFGEIMVSHVRGGQWSDALDLGPPVNSPLDEFHPSFSPDEDTLFFVRRDPFAADADGTIYRIPVAALGNRLHPDGFAR